MRRFQGEPITYVYVEKQIRNDIETFLVSRSVFEYKSVK